MLQTIRKPQSIQYLRHTYFTALILIILHHVTPQRLYEGDTCSMKSIAGICTIASQCETLEPLIKQKQLKVQDILRCGFALREEVICCPIIRNRDQTDTATTPVITTTTQKPTTTSTTTTTTQRTPIITTTTTKEPIQISTTTESYTEPAVKKACNLIEANALDTIELKDTDQILDRGVFRFLGEIGFIQVARQLEPVTYDCTGTLINSKFLLTAAYCFNDRTKEAKIVRFGITNSFEKDQMKDVVYGEIKAIHSHPKYISGTLFHNIAIVELRHPIQSTKYIYPICLETDYGDTIEFKLTVSYWQPGMILNKNFKFLLKAMQEDITLSTCENSYIVSGVPSHMEYELRDTQICAKFQLAQQATCISANGDPLLTLDGNDNYRLIGIFSGVNNCNSTNSITNLYTRVDAYLDFIERIVWPEENQLSRHNTISSTTTVRTTTQTTPIITTTQSTTTTTTTQTTPTITTTLKTTTKEPTSTSVETFSERPASKACNFIEANGFDTIELRDTDQILDQGVFRFIGEIGFIQIDKPQEPVAYDCTGTLINSKFVLTAAHCFNDRNKEPRMIRFGVTNSVQQEQLKDAVYGEVNVIHVHPKYIPDTSFHNIAIVELKNPIQSTKFVYPICLETDYDGTLDLKLLVSYWQTGTVLKKRVKFLLKAVLEELSLNTCQNSYIVSGAPNNMQTDLLDTQMCAKFKISQQEYCISANGGPLLTLDANSNYRIFGIFSGTNNCNSTYPIVNLFTRVDAYLDFIEHIVWPEEIQSS